MDVRRQQKAIGGYYASVAFMDAQVGKVLDALERSGQADHTIVIFTSDHGYHLGERGWWNKNTLFEYSARAPLMVVAPGAKANGKACDRLVEFVDVYPTVAELCGLPPPANLQGESLRPLLDDVTRPGKAAAFTQVARGGRTIRTDRYRYTEWNDGKAGVELYDHMVDPGEYHNLASDAAHAATAADLKKQLHAK